MEQQKPWLTGAGIGSSTVAGNKSAVSYDSTQRLSIASAHQSSTSPSHWKTYICTNPCTPEFISERPLSVDCTWYLPSKDYSMDSEEVKIELHKGKPRKYILGGCWSEFISDIPVDNINPCCVENVTSSLWSSLQKPNSTRETLHTIPEQFSKTSRSSNKKGSLRDCLGQRSLKETWFSFSSVQSLSRVRVFATPWIAARQASLSITNSRSSLKLTSIESVMLSRHD